ncbi:MAG TPA: hypothetical protein VHZ97_03555 [Pseudonocardiaceae bacterium]|jgi:hypothetical protein|nr:hypothetical protein [Pseudonocardiaceae bacterium]
MQPGPPYPQQQSGYSGGGYQQQPFSGQPAPRKPGTGTYVLIVVLALVIVGGVTTGVILLAKNKNKSTPAVSNSQAAGRYKQPVPCDKLNGGPFTFDTPAHVEPAAYGLTLGCAGQAQDSANVVITLDVLTGPDAVTEAKTRVVTALGPQIDGTGFENAPYVYYDANNQICDVQYARSNEDAQLSFLGLPGVTDQASCVRVAMPYAQQYYKLIG